ncbi:MAG: hypothetical protein SGI77_06920 [Pirellulaceae bacterium]|nr:hypothetical protein [Pirellulaceae bacterium]
MKSVLLVLLCALAISPLLSIRESLWIDELHSAWTISGEWSEIEPRAASGNQSPLYFYGLRAFSTAFRAFEQTGVGNEAILRASSLIGWWMLCGFSLLTIHRRNPIDGKWVTMMVIALWLWIDRIGAFYAIELRPYIWVAVLSLFVMQSGAKLAEQPNRLGIAWLIASSLVFYLHYTSLIVIGLSWLAIVAAIAWRWTSIESPHRRPIVGWRLVEIALLSLLCAPGLLQLNGSYRNVQQWSSFAGDGSLVKLVDILPWCFWMLIPTVAYTTQKWLRERPSHGRTLRSAKVPMAIATESGNATDPSAWLLQLFAVGFGTVLIAWLFTYLNIAPLMHRRYVIGSYPAILLAGAFCLGGIRNSKSVLLVGLVSAGLLAYWQGTTSEWYAGRWIAWQRQEDWRGAAVVLSDLRKPKEPIFLAPMLIETTEANVHNTKYSSYFKFALASLYRVSEADSIQILSNSRIRWKTDFLEYCRANSHDVGWIVARVDASALDGIDAGMQSKDAVEIGWKFERVFNGGRVQVLKVEKR